MVTQNDILVLGRKITSISDAKKAKGGVIPALKKELDYLAKKAEKPKDGEPREVTILGDSHTPYSLLKQIMVTCAEADFTKVSLAVTQEEKKVGGS